MVWDRLQGYFIRADLSPKIILRLDLMATQDTMPKKTNSASVTDLEVQFQIQADRTSISDLWATIIPENTKRQSLHGFLAASGKDILLYPNYRSASSFRDGYRQQNAICQPTRPLEIEEREHRRESAA